MNCSECGAEDADGREGVHEGEVAYWCLRCWRNWTRSRCPGYSCLEELFGMTEQQVVNEYRLLGIVPGSPRRYKMLDPICNTNRLATQLSVLNEKLPCVVPWGVWFKSEVARKTPLVGGVSSESASA